MWDTVVSLCRKNKKPFTVVGRFNSTDFVWSTRFWVLHIEKSISARKSVIGYWYTTDHNFDCIPINDLCVPLRAILWIALNYQKSYYPIPYSTPPPPPPEIIYYSFVWWHKSNKTLIPKCGKKGYKNEILDATTERNPLQPAAGIWFCAGQILYCFMN